MQTLFYLEEDESSLLLWLARSFLYGLSFPSPTEHKRTHHSFSLSMNKNVPSLSYHRAARCRLHGCRILAFCWGFSASINGIALNNSTDIFGAENQIGNGHFLGKCWHLLSCTWQRNVLWVLGGNLKNENKKPRQKYKLWGNDEETLAETHSRVTSGKLCHLSPFASRNELWLPTSKAVLLGHCRDTWKFIPTLIPTQCSPTDCKILPSPSCCDWCTLTAQEAFFSW